MANQILFLEKNKADFSIEDLVITASEGDDFADLMVNRNNLTAWVTDGSADANLTNVVFDWVDPKPINTILIIKHNFKSYTVQYWNGTTYVDFSTAIDVTGNTAETKYHTFTEVTTTKVKLVVRGTMVVDDDKFCYQFIASKSIGRLNGFPTIKGTKLSRNRLRSKMLSGKENIREQVGFFSCTIEWKILSDTTDIATVESLFRSNEGFLVWLCGGSETQFRTGAEGYRLEDIYLCKCTNEYQPEIYKGGYWAGLNKLGLALTEVVD